MAYLCRLLGEQYGFVRTKYHTGYVIAEDGSATVTTLEAVKAINAELPGIEHYTAVITDPEHSLGSFQVKVTGDSDQKDTRIIPKSILSTPNRLYYQLLFDPPVQPTNELEYIYTVMNPPRTFASSEEELLKRTLPYDYVSMKIAYPTQIFVMKITFPQEWLIEHLSFDVWMGDARLRLAKEYVRLKEEGALVLKYQNNTRVAELTVNYPILDLKYVITWHPSSISTNG